MDNWLAKLAAEQPTIEENLEQALGELSIDELRELQNEPATPNLDSFEEKVAQADQMGRELAKEHGPGLAAQAEQRALQNHAVMNAIQDLPDDEAVKLAFVIDNGSEEQVKEAFAALANLARKAITSKGMRSAVGKAGRFAKKNPNAAMAIGGAAAGGVANKAQGGSFTRGAVTGAGLGYGAGKLTGVSGSRLSKGIGGGYGKALGWANKTAAPLSGAIGAMVASDMSKVAFYDHKNEWLSQFEGTPLLQQALDMAERELQMEMQQIEERNSRPDTFAEQDKLRAQKKLLELQLVAQRNGLSEPDGDEIGGEATTADHPEGDGDEMHGNAPEEHGLPEGGMEEAQEQVKEAYARALNKEAFIDQGIGYFVGKSKGRAQKERGEKHTFGGKQIASLLLPGGIGYQAGRAMAHDESGDQKEKKAALPAARIGRFALQGAKRPAALGTAIGGVSGALKKPEEGESRLGNIVRRGAKGAVIGGVAGAGMGAGAAKMHNVLRHKPGYAKGFKDSLRNMTPKARAQADKLFEGGSRAFDKMARLNPR